MVHIIKFILLLLYGPRRTIPTFWWSLARSKISRGFILKSSRNIFLWRPRPLESSSFPDRESSSTSPFLMLWPTKLFVLSSNVLKKLRSWSIIWRNVQPVHIACVCFPGNLYHAPVELISQRRSSCIQGPRLLVYRGVLTIQKTLQQLGFEFKVDPSIFQHWFHLAKSIPDRDTSPSLSHHHYDWLIQLLNFTILIDFFVHIIGEKFYVYDGTRQATPKGGRLIRQYLSPNLPKAIAAAIHNRTKGTTDFLRGKKVWRFDEINGGVKTGFPKKLHPNAFPGLPNKPTGAFEDKNGRYKIKHLVRGDNKI